MAKETKKLPTIDIKGKPYVKVNERVLELHRQNDSFSLTTEIISDDDKKVVMQTRLKIDGRMFTGIASEDKDQASPYENCETSSVGRCIGFYSIGIIESIESSDGMTKFHNKNKYQEPKLASEAQKDLIKKRGLDKKLNITDKQFEKMTMTEAHKLLN